LDFDKFGLDALHPYPCNSKPCKICGVKPPHYSAPHHLLTTPALQKKKLLELYVKENKAFKILVLYIFELFKSRAFRKYHPHVCLMPQKKV
jgi:hypothetical protein